jgi:hypothetical protein
MHRPFVLIIPALCAFSLYGVPIGGPISCGAGTTPTITLMVDQTLYTNFNMQGNSQGCTISGTFGSALTTGYTVTVTAFTQPDPVIDFGMNFSSSGDPVVTLMISTPYTGGPFTSIYSTGAGTLTDTDGNGSASALPQSGSDIQLVKVNGSIITQPSPVNPGCSFTGQAPFFSQACPPPTARLASGSFPATGTLEVDAAFILSAGDSYNVTGSTSFTPEPATAFLLGAGLLAMAGLVRRSRVR